MPAASGGSRSSQPSSWRCPPLATAWSGYPASLWDGIQSSDYTQASALRTRSSQQHTEANQYRLADLTLFENFVDATVSGNAELAAFYRARFRDTATTLFFAAALFFAAVSERFSFPRARAGLLGLAVVGLVVGAAIAVTQPVTSG